VGGWVDAGDRGEEVNGGSVGFLPVERVLPVPMMMLLLVLRR